MNHCTFQGRLSGAPIERMLPSGDVIVVFRLVVPRTNQTRVDTIDCAVSMAKLRRAVLRLGAGTELSVEGQLQRRFWRIPSGVASRYEVQASAVQRVG